MCLGNSQNPGTFSSLTCVKSVLPGEFLLIYPKIFGGPPGVLQRGVNINGQINVSGLFVLYQLIFMVNLPKNLK